MLRFLWMTPMPPCCAIAMASRLSVTVSIAALRIGTLRRMRRVSRDATSTWLGRTCECRGTSSDVVERQRFGQPGRHLRGRAQRSVIVSSSLIDAAPRTRDPSGAMALLEFLAAAAPARVVAADLRLVAPNGLHRRVVAAGARGPRRPAADGAARRGRATAPATPSTSRRSA